MPTDVRPAELVARSGAAVSLPAFLPDATRGVVRGLDSADLRAAGVQAVMVNSLHLATDPGVSTIASVGGIHAFMDWNGLVASDSGGFQVYSLLTDNPSLGSVDRKGFRWRPAVGRPAEVLTPERCIERQFRLGADIMFTLDYCTHPDAPALQQRDSVELTIHWARLCRKAFDRQLETRRKTRRPLLLAVVQGGNDRGLRRECAERLIEIGFDGYAYGGWPVNAQGELVDAVQWFCEDTPPDLPRHALGIGNPQAVFDARRMGFDLFDCVLPSRDARHKRLYVRTGSPLGETDWFHYLHLQDTKYCRDARPVQDGCDCPCCARFTRSYLHHLYQINDSLAGRLATLHNLRFYTRLCTELSQHDTCA